MIMVLFKKKKKSFYVVSNICMMEAAIWEMLFDEAAVKLVKIHHYIMTNGSVHVQCQHNIKKWLDCTIK